MNNLFACPKCMGSLLKKNDSFHCKSCGFLAPVYHGVADFRGVSPDYRPLRLEQKIKETLLSAFHTSSFAELIKIRFSQSTYSGKMKEFQKGFELSYEAKGTYRSFQIKKMLSDSGMSINRDAFLDIGCGTGTAVPWMISGFKRYVGVDYSLIDLICGQKFLQERSISNVELVCADARHLPMRDEVFDLVNATDVIEHIVPGQGRFMAEVRRTLKKGGSFYFNSPNRFNIFTPEPHVKVWFVGFMPRSWMHRYVNMVTGQNYRNYKLLSLSELRSITHEYFGKSFFLTGPFIDFDAPATDFKRQFIKRFPFLLTVINRLLFYFVTGFNVIALKK